MNVQTLNLNLRKSLSFLTYLTAVFCMIYAQAAIAAPEGHVIEESQSNRKVLNSKFRNAFESSVRDGINRIPSHSQLPQALINGNVELTIQVISRLPLGSIGF